MKRRSSAGKLTTVWHWTIPSHKLTIVVASDGSTDGTEAILHQYERYGVIVHYYPQRAGKMAAINRLMPTLESDLIVLSDANVMYAPDALRKLVRNFADESVGAVSGKVTLVSNQPIPGIPERLYYRYEWILQRLGVTHGIVNRRRWSDVLGCAEPSFKRCRTTSYSTIS